MTTRLLHTLIATVFVALPLDSARALPAFDVVKADFRSSDVLVTDRSGQPLQRLRTDASVRRGQWVALADMSPALREAMLLSEDRRFYEHSGIDWRAVSAAAWGNLWHSKTRGASTITMQLAGLLDDDLQHRPGGRSLTAKLGQTVAAQVLERRWRKDQILEAWLNLVPLRGELVGIDALSQTLFDKAPHGLDDREAAVAAALVRAPNARPAQVSQRACGLLKTMAITAPVTTSDCTGLDTFTALVLQRKAFAPSEGIAPHLAQQLLRHSAAPSTGTLTASLRAPLQRFASQSLQQHLRELRGRHVHDGAVLVLDNASGEVLAWVGSSGPLSANTELDHVLTLRQPGSTLKPFLYAQAIAQQRLTAASLLDDAPTHIATAGGLYVPQNYDHRFKGLVSVRTALAASLNVPAVRTLAMVSPDAFHKQLRALGLPLKESGDFYGFSLALGSAEVSLLNLTNAYRALANGGRVGPVRLTPVDSGRGGPAPDFCAFGGMRAPGCPAPGQRPQALDPHAAFIVSDILSDPHARTRTFGTDSVLATRFWTAVKTGTSKDLRDNWALGYSSRYTVGVWVGNASGAPMWDVSGTSGAAPVWAAVMQFLHQHEPSRAPAPPAGLQHAAVVFGPGLEAARDEWFLPGTAQARFAIDSGAESIATTGAKGQKDSKMAARITSPASGTIVALDPDIPPNRQRLHLQASGPNVRWQLDGKPLARGARVAWLPWPGKHTLTLLDAKGQTLDSVRFEVRGAGVRLAQGQTPPSRP